MSVLFFGRFKHTHQAFVDVDPPQKKLEGEGEYLSSLVFSKPLSLALRYQPYHKQARRSVSSG